MGAGRVIVVDHLDYRLEKARTFAYAETVNFAEHDDLIVLLKKMTDHLAPTSSSTPWVPRRTAT